MRKMKSYPFMRSTMAWILALGLGLAPLSAVAQEKPKGPPPDAEDDEEREEQDVSPREEEEIRGFLKANNREMFMHLEEARAANPKVFRRKMREMRPMLKHPEAREMLARNMKSELMVRKLAHVYRQGEGKDKEAAKKELRAALAEQFDAKLAAHETRIQHMSKEIERLKEKIQKRKGLKDKLVEKRLNELTGDEESWDW